jgi:hypothetical protein
LALKADLTRSSASLICSAKASAPILGSFLFSSSSSLDKPLSARSSGCLDLAIRSANVPATNWPKPVALVDDTASSLNELSKPEIKITF